ncbi:MAG: hypothetical protein NUV90_02600 [Candidatus Parcubacteria bacterium]|nr:hypothetical protein [Candidatus Parcubacteria bacterium]
MRLSGNVVLYLTHKEKKMLEFLRSLVAQPKLAVHCGHLVSQVRGKVTAFDETRTCTIPRDSDGHLPYCHACIGSMTIRCAWCGLPIFVGDMVTLYSVGGKKPDQKIPDHAVILNAKSRTLVGCARISCADSGADYTGFWIPADKQRNGRWIGGVRSFPSAIDIAMETGEAVVINNMVEHAMVTAENRIIVPMRMARAT